MALPSPSDYSDWQTWANAIMSALQGGALAELIAGDPYASAVVAQAGIGSGGSGGDGVPAGYSPVWLSDDDAELYLGQSTIPPTAGSLFEIDTLNLADLAITFEKLGAAAVQTTNIADAAILTAKIGDAQIVTAKIGDLQVNTAKLANLAVTSAKIANLAVGTAQLDNASITSAKIGALQVDTAALANAAITNAKIGALAVDTANINSLAVTHVKIGDYVIDAQKIAQYGVTEYDTVEAFGSQALNATWTLLTLGGTQVYTQLMTPNITGDMAFIIFCRLDIDVPAGPLRGYGRVQNNATVISPFPCSRVFSAGGSAESLVWFEIHASPAPNTTYVHHIRVQGDTAVSVLGAQMYTVLLKR